MSTDATALTSALLWRAAFVVAAIDVPLLVLAGRGVSRERFAALKWPLPAAAGFVCASLWAYFGAAYFEDVSPDEMQRRYDERARK